MGWNPLKDVKKFYSGAGGFLFGKDYSKKDIKAINAGLAPAEQQIPLLFGQSNAALLKALGAIDQGYGLAHKNLALQGQIGTRAINDTATRGYANAAQSAVGRGLYGTTYLDAANRGVSADQGQSLAQLNAMLGQLGSNLSISQAQDTAGLYSQMANLGPQQASILAGLYGGKASLMSQVGYGKQGGALNDILKIGGALATGGFG